MTRQTKSATVRFYFDADVLGAAKVIARLRNDCTYPGDPGAVIRRRLRPACVVTSPRALDKDWIPTVSQHEWLIISRDSRIQHRLAEINAVVANKARMVTLSGKDAGTTWEQLEILFSRWRSIEQLLEEPGPYIYRATRSGLALQQLP